jgi:hypothetical protein
MPGRVFGEQFGEQIERNWDEVRSRDRNTHWPRPLSDTASVTLGAGRAQVQILSRRLIDGRCSKVQALTGAGASVGSFALRDRVHQSTLES